jgi:DHA1 family bicyclomycin/chloramphenicol resistance-like MFS transporter
VLVLGSLSAFGALTIDMYLPAMPGMAAELGTSAPVVQLTLIGFVIGLALGQVVVGPLSDSWGRRTPLLIGMAVYVAGSTWCALAPDAGSLIGGASCSPSAPPPAPSSPGRSCATCSRAPR